MASFGSIKQAIFDKQARKQQYQDHIRGLNAFDRHKKFLDDYVVYYGKQKPARETLPVKTDQDTIREGYRFIMTEEDDVNPSWEHRLVKRYYDKLFKDYEVNFSYFEAGENKQALVKLVACERCAEKLYYKKQKEKEQLKLKEHEKLQRKRDRSESDDDTIIKHGKSKERRKGDKALTSDSDRKTDDDENFDEYLSGMFP